MKTLLLFALLVATAAGTQAQEIYFEPRADTLQSITRRSSFWSVSGYRFEYGSENYSSPRRLRPYFLASGDSLALNLFEKSRRKKRTATLVHIAGGIAAAFGVVLLVSDAINVITTNNSSNSRAIPGGILTGIGVGGGVTGMLLRTRSNAILFSAIDRYNQSRRPRVSWQMVPTGTGLRLVGTF
jgi:hypothetical protein